MIYWFKVGILVYDILVYDILVYGRIFWLMAKLSCCR